jgi:crossover junction endodeoxyribonuclease RuvC
VRILGLDPGTRVCGYGVIDCRGEELSYVECGVITAPAEHAMEARLGEIAKGLRDVIAELAPEVVAVEDVFSQMNPRTALALAQGRGMALAVIGLCGLSVASYPPATVKKTVTGSGKAEKDQVARLVQMSIGLRSMPRMRDATDALAVAITHARISRPTVARLVDAVVPPRQRALTMAAAPRKLASIGSVVVAPVAVVSQASMKGATSAMDAALASPQGTLEGIAAEPPEARRTKRPHAPSRTSRVPRAARSSR